MHSKIICVTPWSHDLIDDVIIRSALGHFLFKSNWYQASTSTSNHFRDISIKI